MPFLVAILALKGAVPSSLSQALAKCEYDPHILDLPGQAFDQDPNVGWRSLAEKPGCEKRAADVIRQYRSYYLGRIPMLFWHEAQLRATIGETKRAIDLMERSKLPAREGAFGCNFYVDATIAFLRHDHKGFLRARSRNESLKRPANWIGEWPMNGAVIRGLGTCFNKPYGVAYGSTCRPVPEDLRSSEKQPL